MLVGKLLSLSALQFCVIILLGRVSKVVVPFSILNTPCTLNTSFSPAKFLHKNQVVALLEFLVCDSVFLLLPLKFFFFFRFIYFLFVVNFVIH